MKYSAYYRTSTDKKLNRREGLTEEELSLLIIALAKAVPTVKVKICQVKG